MEIEILEKWLGREQKNIVDLSNRIKVLEDEQKEMRENLATHQTDIIALNNYDELVQKALNDLRSKGSTPEVSLLTKFIMWAKGK